jgi:carboxylesterase type B
MSCLPSGYTTVTPQRPLPYRRYPPTKMIFHSPSTKHTLFLLASLFYYVKITLALSHSPAYEPVPVLVPSVTVKNGRINGRFLSGVWEQDLFLGIPYAQSPVGSLRFKAPQPVNESYIAPLDASEYGNSCYQYGSNFRLSEDCLTLNGMLSIFISSPPFSCSFKGSPSPIHLLHETATSCERIKIINLGSLLTTHLTLVIRPHQTPSSSTPLLPVLVWIHGGGLFAGSSADPQYNLSGIVRLSQDMFQPIVAVSLNYRLGVWGFLQAPELLAEGDSGGTNAGLLDQRLALRWVRENIASFGGDPERVTIWGESAGAQSIALHLHSSPNLDSQSKSAPSVDGKKRAKDVERPLFRAAILESGSAIGLPLPPLEHYTCYFDDLIQKVGCEGANDRLSCLRSVSSEKLFEAEAPAFIYPIVDG